MAGYLHEDRALMLDAINHVVELRGLDPVIIEKDYYVSLLLMKISAINPDLVFKGGTSLSKCYGLIDRFSEDIDIAFFGKATGTVKGEVMDGILKSIEEVGLTLTNPEAIKHRQKLNHYRISYVPVASCANPSVKGGEIEVETSYFFESEPVKILEVHSYLGDFIAEEAESFLEMYEGLKAFPMKVQSLERTLVDKVFAICDYYLDGKCKRKSRHLYDIHKLLSEVQIDDAFKYLVLRIRSARAKDPGRCPSAQPGVDIPELINRIIAEEAYLEDWENITEGLIYEHVSYDEVIESLRRLNTLEMF